MVLSPHLYPPSVGNPGNPYDFSANQDYVAPALGGRLLRSFGYLNKAPGYCLPLGACHIFAVAVGEIGSKFTAGTPVRKTYG